jgi:hypothetical protein
VLAAAPGDTGEPYEVSAEYKFEQSLDGDYEIKFRVLMYCDTFDCKETNDFLKVFIGYDAAETREYNSEPIEAVSAQNLGSFNKWVEKKLQVGIKSQSGRNFKVYFYFINFVLK